MMGAWLWTGNPDRWKASNGMDGYKAMWTYLHDKSDYVYWATTAFHDRVKVGDIAYIWRSQSKFSNRNGIVAVGIVQEEPREYTEWSKAEFAYPERLDAIGWDEDLASSRWKTGISIKSRRWNRELHVSGLMLRQSINLVTDEQRLQIETQLAR